MEHTIHIQCTYLLPSKFGPSQKLTEAHKPNDVCWGGVQTKNHNTGFNCLLLLQIPVGSIGQTHKATYYEKCIEIYRVSLPSCLSQLVSNGIHLALQQSIRALCVGLCGDRAIRKVCTHNLLFHPHNPILAAPTTEARLLSSHWLTLSLGCTNNMNCASSHMCNTGTLAEHVLDILLYSIRAKALMWCPYQLILSA